MIKDFGHFLEEEVEEIYLNLTMIFILNDVRDLRRKVRTLTIERVRVVFLIDVFSSVY